jgi:tRNA 2-thiouridine synthesizing protein A
VTADAAEGLPAYDVLLDERGALCPLPVIALARAFSADPVPERVLLLADDPAATTDIPAWCSLRRRGLEWTGTAADGTPAFLVTSTAGEATA